MPDENKKYRIYVRWNDRGTGVNIDDEDIWVGNVPNDGKSKITSGLTINAAHSYVDFDTWEDLLDAIGASSATPTITITADAESVPKDGGVVTYTINIQNGVYVSYEILDSYGTFVSEDRSNPNSIKLKISYPENDTGEEQQVGIKATVRGIGEHSSTTYHSDPFMLTWESGEWSLTDVDYVIFTFSWDETDGRDLDSFTFVDGLASSSTDFYGSTFERGVGFANGEGFDEKYIGPARGCGVDNAILRFSHDNREDGAEYTLVNFKNLKDTITQGIQEGVLDPNSKIIIYLMTSWYTEKLEGYTSVSLTAYRGGEIVRRGASENYRYDITGETEIVDEYQDMGINIFAKTGQVYNARVAIDTYTTTAAFVYDYGNNKFTFVSGDKLKTLDGGRRYKYGLNSNMSVFSNHLSVDGDINFTIEQEGKAPDGDYITESNLYTPTIKIKITNDDFMNNRAYNIKPYNPLNEQLQMMLIAASGDTRVEQTKYLEILNISTPESGETGFDDRIVFQIANDGPYKYIKMMVPDNYMHQCTGDYDGARVYYYPDDKGDDLLKLWVKSRSSSLSSHNDSWLIDMREEKID
jgi:hypothetical protein